MAKQRNMNSTIWPDASYGGAIGTDHETLSWSDGPTLKDFETSFAALARLLDQRLALVRTLADSLESTRSAFRQNNAEAIARGAAHQAELCRQWGLLEAQLRDEATRSKSLPPSSSTASEISQAARIEIEWKALGSRIRYLTRVHWSLLRHMHRSLAVLTRIVASSAPTYVPPPTLLDREIRPAAGE